MREFGESVTDLVLEDVELNELELALGGLVSSAFPPLTLIKDAEQTAIARVLADGRLEQLREFGHRPFPALRINRLGALKGDAVLVVSEDVPTDGILPVEYDTLVVLDRGDHDRLGRSIQRARSLHPTVRILPIFSELNLAGIEDVLSKAGAASITWWQTDRVLTGGIVVMFTGFSGSGKSTIARSVADRLRETDARPVTLLDGDEVRSLLSRDLGFSRPERELNVRRIAWVSALVARHGGIALCAPIAPYESLRAEARRLVTETGAIFLLVHVSTPLEVCEQRDRKGLYARARAGDIESFTGISDPFETPHAPELRLDTSIRNLDECVADVLTIIELYSTNEALSGFHGSPSEAAP
jgi:sulfate adenylyltransferase